jgi:hypothetical protein
MRRGSRGNAEPEGPFIIARISQGAVEEDAAVPGHCVRIFFSYSMFNRRSRPRRSTHQHGQKYFIPLTGKYMEPSSSRTDANEIVSLLTLASLDVGCLIHSAFGIFDNTLDRLSNIFCTSLGLLAEAFICKRPPVENDASGLSSTHTEEEEVYSCEAAEDTVLVMCEKYDTLQKCLQDVSGLDDEAPAGPDGTSGHEGQVLVERER